MDRRLFIKTSGTAAALTAIGFPALVGATTLAASSTLPNEKGDLVAVMGDNPAAMLNKAIEELGGISKFVKAGQKVVVKPNIGWAKEPEMSANTNPLVVGALVKLCIDAGVKEVLVFDHTCHEWTSCYEKSGIKEATESNGGTMIPGNNEKDYQEVQLPQGIKLKKTTIHQAIIDCDVWFNVPVLKHHGGAKMSLSMKNSMGIIWDRKAFHLKGLQQCIADLATYDKKPALNIVDAYRCLTQNGPQGKSKEDAQLTKALFASVDPVAVDTASVKFFAQIKDMKLEDVQHIGLAEKHQLGTQNLANKNVKKFKI